ncbi:polysaccharide biosynthesis tyrosine autokinase [Nocardioides sp.]|uniref:polysaccharide biosynthesis tyrosine autokinase n=1 Tax=Nocardioides sp. TaxID=35761 RepID=UPI0027335245|nr:polysaccharide biosynthesis tyrosine autokinase [Nocardioides sp.]MDP3890439.1 polysaccharide biosynthesis tyrosine autokinase [Nocardioides sp.]
MDFKHFSRLIRRRWKSIFAMLILALAVGSAFTFTQTPQYQSQVKLFVSADANAEVNPYGASLFTTTRVASYAQLANHRVLMADVIEELGLSTSPTQLASRVSASVEPQTVIIAITVTDPDPTMAQEIARVTGEVMVDYVEELETPEGQVEAQIRASITDPATFNSNPVSPQTTLNLAVAALVGLLLGVALATARDLLDTTIKSIEDMEEVTDSPVMASIGVDSSMAKKPLLTQLRGFSPRGEGFRMLRTNLQFLDLDNQPKSLVITSAVAGEGKTTTSTNLAIALAQAGRRVLLVDGDLRRPRIAGLLGLESSIGLTTVLVGRTRLDQSIQLHEESGVHFLSCGPTPPNPSEILQANATHELLHKLRDSYDAVIIDAPPLLPVADAAILATAADGAIIVTRHGKTTRDQLRAATQRLDKVGARLFGTVVNMIPRRFADSYYYYYYYDTETVGSTKKANRKDAGRKDEGRKKTTKPTRADRRAASS